MESIGMLEWFGYVASVVVAISLMMSSIIKLRWYNLVGALCFSIYGFLIEALPVGFLNGFIALADIYYLVLIYREKDSFTLLEVDKKSEYLNVFLEFYGQEIAKFFPAFSLESAQNSVGFFILRNTVPAGVLLGKKQEGGEFLVEIDFATPQFRDFKLGQFVFHDHLDFFRRLGSSKLTAHSHTGAHDKYLAKMGFSKKSGDNNSKVFERVI